MTVRSQYATPALVDAPQRGTARGVRMPHSAASVPLARRVFLSDVTSQLGSGTVAAEAGVVVSELLGNAVRHARALADGELLLRWQVRGGVVDVEVTDGGGVADVRPRRPSALATQGRGLRIVRSLAHEWGVSESSDGRRTVWAALGGPSRRRRRD